MDADIRPIPGFAANRYDFNLKPTRERIPVLSYDITLITPSGESGTVHSGMRDARMYKDLVRQPEFVGFRLEVRPRVRWILNPDLYY